VSRILVAALLVVAGAAAMFAWQRFRTPQLAPPTAERVVTPAVVTEKIAPPRIERPAVAVEAAPAPAPGDSLRVMGLTEPAPGRFAKLPLATSQAIAFVDVKPGDKVKKGIQVFSHWESPDRLQAAKNELAKAKKLVDIAKSRATAAEKTAARIRGLKATVTAQELEDAETAALIRLQEADAAELALAETESRFAAMQFEFQQAFVTSPIEGTVASVDVVIGERRQLSGSFRGVTVLDSRVLACRCFLTPSQIARLPWSKGDKEAPVAIESEGVKFTGKITSVGVMVDPATGQVPVVLEIPNPDEALRAGQHVSVSFTTPQKLD
jgi:multidrug efflux pump subunit AcrA (membrane-fusion protein)